MSLSWIWLRLLLWIYPLTHASFSQCVCLSKAAPDETLGVILVCAVLGSVQHPEPTLGWVPVPLLRACLWQSWKSCSSPSVQSALRDFLPPLSPLGCGELGFGHQWCPSFSFCRVVSAPPPRDIGWAQSALEPSCGQRDPAVHLCCCFWCFWQAFVQTFTSDAHPRAFPSLFNLFNWFV